MNYHIRPADETDIELIRSLAQDIWPKAYGDMISQEQLAYMLQWMYSADSLHSQLGQGHRFLILEDDEHKGCGYASYRPLETGKWKLEKLYVQVDLHRRGLGRMLLQRVIEEIKHQGATHLYLQVNRQNPSVQFYSRLGFQVARDEDIDIGNGFFMNDHIMEISIS
ncbi:MAG: N-acetyltransferase family protein [Bacteroidota bacterium]